MLLVLYPILCRRVLDTFDCVRVRSDGSRRRLRSCGRMCGSGAVDDAALYGVWPVMYGAFGTLCGGVLGALLNCSRVGSSPASCRAISRSVCSCSSMMLARPDALEVRRAREARACAIHGELIDIADGDRFAGLRGSAAERTSLGTRSHGSDN